MATYVSIDKTGDAPVVEKLYVTGDGRLVIKTAGNTAVRFNYMNSPDQRIYQNPLSDSVHFVSRFGSTFNFRVAVQPSAEIISEFHFTSFGSANWILPTESAGQTPESTVVNYAGNPTADAEADLKTAARDYHEYLESLSARLEGTEAKIWRSAVVGVAHDIIAKLHFGANVIMAKRVPSVSSLTVIQRIAWAKQGLLGPSDIRDLDPFTQVDERVHRIYSILDAGYVAPTIPFTYIDPRTSAPVKMVDAVNLCGTGTFTLDGGSSPADDVVGLGLNTITDFTGNNGVDIHGSWIDHLRE